MTTYSPCSNHQPSLWSSIEAFRMLPPKQQEEHSSARRPWTSRDGLIGGEYQQQKSLLIRPRHLGDEHNSPTARTSVSIAMNMHLQSARSALLSRQNFRDKLLRVLRPRRALEAVVATLLLSLVPVRIERKHLASAGKPSGPGSPPPSDILPVGSSTEVTLSPPKTDTIPLNKMPYTIGSMFN